MGKLQGFLVHASKENLRTHKTEKTVANSVFSRRCFNCIKHYKSACSKCKLTPQRKMYRKKKNMRNLALSFLLLSILIVSLSLSVDAKAKTCKPSGKIKGKKPPKDQCNQDHGSDCCESGKYYNTYKCSPPVTSRTKAVLTINGFGKGDDGGGPSECDGKYHSDDTPIVALSTGWFNNMKRCFKNITIHGNGKSVAAMVVDECDSTMGCDDEHDYQPPCHNNIVDASEAVWKALGVPENDWGEMEIKWSDA